MERRQIDRLDPDRVGRRLEEVRRVAGPEVEVLVASKYVAVEAMGALAEAGVDLVGENRLDALEEKQERWGDAFAWDFIGNVQSRKLKAISPRVRLIHSVCTESVAAQLGRHADPEREVLVQVNLAGEESKQGVAPDRLDEMIEAIPVRVAGLATMPPAVDDPEGSRPWFRELRRLADERGLGVVSMGTSQDWRVAVEEGATIIRLGAALFG